jgi:large subunit ribosomal protein L24
MKKLFSKSWKSSKKPRKQREYLYNSPFHIRRRFLATNLSKELRKKFGIRNVGVVKDDEVKVMRGQYKGKIGKISRVNIRKIKVYVDSIYRLKLDGSKSYYPIHPSNLMIINLNLNDKKRKKKLEKKIKK